VADNAAPKVSRFNHSEVTLPHSNNLIEPYMPKKKTLRSFCSVCNQATEMEVMGIDKETDLIWVRCPHCKGIFPPHPKSTTSKNKDKPK
jgi:hypothetical protein